MNEKLIMDMQSEINNMNKEEKIEVIYKTIANKERTFGCKYIIKNRDQIEYEVRETEWECVDLTYWSEYQIEYWNDMTETNYLESIIWHPILIWDVLDWVKSIWKKDYYQIFLSLWKDLRNPIEEQSDGCIDFLYSLIEKQNA